MRQRYSHREGIGEHLVISDDILVEQHFVDVVKEARYSRTGGRNWSEGGDGAEEGRKGRSTTKLLGHRRTE